MAKESHPELEPYMQELWETIMRLIHSFRTSMSMPEEMELTFPQTMLLLELHAMGRCSMGELSHRLRVTQGVATRMVDRLLDKGLVERARDEADRRVVLVAPTKQGVRIARRIEGVNRGKMKELFMAVPERERADLLALLKGMERQFEKEETVRPAERGESRQGGETRSKSGGYTR